jgi:hypothetical protein
MPALAGANPVKAVKAVKMTKTVKPKAAGAKVPAQRKRAPRS